MPRVSVLRLPASALLALGLAAATPARAAFTGEVLLTPELSGWTVVAHESTEPGDTRLLRRDLPPTSTWAEEIRISSRDTEGTPKTAPAVAAIVAHARAGCTDVHVDKPVHSTTNGYAAVLVALTCKGPKRPATNVTPKDARLRFVMAKVIAGDFRLHQVVRTWEGLPGHEDSPASSPDLRQGWTRFFASVELCSTLVAPCTPLSSRMPSGPQHFVTMPTLKTTPPPTVESPALLEKAAKFGTLTGRAEACGEDTSLLMNEIARIFRTVATSERDAATAQTFFLEARDKARAEQKASPLPCKDVLHLFRQHPTRARQFAAYLKSL